jgi:cytoskeletal protein CcmA (bactofilin family)
MADQGSQEFQTVLGPDVSFKGELSFEKGLRLMGKFEGKINTGGRLLVAKEAKMQADVEAGAIVVEGEVNGNLSANDRIELKNSARYQGDLSASKLIVDEGAVFRGHVTVGPDAVNGKGSAGHRPSVTVTTGPGVQRPQAQPQAQPVK